MVPDAEILTILCEALEALEIGDFTVKVSLPLLHIQHRERTLTQSILTLPMLSDQSPKDPGRYLLPLWCPRGVHARHLLRRRQARQG